MLDFLQRDLQPKSETFGQLTIERRVLITPKSTIPIPNIAVISTGTIGVPRAFAWNLALALLAVGLVVLVAGFTMKNNLAMALGGIGMVGGLTVARLFAKTEMPCLSITSNDGHASVFAGQRRTLEEVRRLLTDKINAGDESAVYRVNFEKGAIQAMSVGHAEAIGAILPTPSNQVAASTGNARLGPTLDTPMPAANVPGPQLANGHYPGGNIAHVDYSQVLPQIVDMQRFYAQRQDTQDIAERLNELEYLMRSGTPTPGSRTRLSQLVAELSSILGAYPGVVQIFQQAARLAGV
jgi:hypothetical protein